MTDSSNNDRAIDLWREELPGWVFWYDEGAGRFRGTPASEFAPAQLSCSRVSGTDLLTAIQQAIMNRM